MRNYRQEVKKQIVKHYVKPTTNSNLKQACILHLLQVPNVEENLMVQEYVSSLKSNQTQTALTNEHVETQYDTKNLLKTANSTENKDNYKEEFIFKVPGKVKKQRKNKKKSQVKTPTRPIVYHSIFDNNLLRANGRNVGCECTVLNSFNYKNPFFKKLFEKPTYKKFTVKSAIVDLKIVSKGHLITFRPIEEFHHIITTMKPTLYASEYVTGTQAAVGMTYSLFIRLAKDNVCVGEYVVKHTFTQAGKKFLEIRICDYLDFDTIYYYHMASNKPGAKLNVKNVTSIKIGKSVLLFLSETIQWTKPDGPKVIVEKVEHLTEPMFY